MFLTESPLVLSYESPNATVSIYIKDDDSAEPPEPFEIILSFYGKQPPRLQLNPSSLTVLITNTDDSKFISKVSVLAGSTVV